MAKSRTMYVAALQDGWLLLVLSFLLRVCLWCLGSSLLFLVFMPEREARLGLFWAMRADQDLECKLQTKSLWAVGNQPFL